MGRPIDWWVRLRMSVCCLLLVCAALAVLAVELVFFVFLWLLVILSVDIAIVGPGSAVPLGRVYYLSVTLGFLTFVGFVGTIAWADFTQPDASLLVTAPTTAADTPLEARVRRLSQQACVPTPAIVVAETAAPLVLSSGLRPKSSTIVVSTGVRETLTDAELEAVLAHEIAHIANRDTAAMTASAVPKRLLGNSPSSSIPTPIVLVNDVLDITLAVLIGAFGRTREYTADDGAVELTDAPAALASALEGLDAAMADQPQIDLRDEVPAVAASIVPIHPPESEGGLFRRLGATHPPTEKRIDRLRERVR